MLRSTASLAAAVPWRELDRSPLMLPPTDCGPQRTTLLHTPHPNTTTQRLNDAFRTMDSVIDYYTLLKGADGTHSFLDGLRKTDAMLLHPAFHVNGSQFGSPFRPIVALPVEDVRRPTKRDYDILRHVLCNVFGPGNSVEGGFRRQGLIRLKLRNSNFLGSSEVDLLLHRRFKSPSELLDEAFSRGFYLPAVYWQDDVYFRDDFRKFVSSGIIDINDGPLTTWHAKSMEFLWRSGFRLRLPFSLDLTRLNTDRFKANREEACILGDKLALYCTVAETDDGSPSANLSRMEILNPTRPDPDDLDTLHQKENLAEADAIDFCRRLLRGQTNWTVRMTPANAGLDRLFVRLVEKNMPIDTEASATEPFRTLLQKLQGIRSNGAANSRIHANGEEGSEGGILAFVKETQRICVTTNVKERIKQSLATREEQWKALQKEYLFGGQGGTANEEDGTEEADVDGERTTANQAGPNSSTRALERAKKWYVEALCDCLEKIILESQADVLRRFHEAKTRGWSSPEVQEYPTSAPDVLVSLSTVTYPLK